MKSEIETPIPVTRSEAMREEKIAPPSAFPISLISKERKKLAKAARELAMECLTNGPEMQDVWCGCAIGLSMKKAGLWCGDYDGLTWTKEFSDSEDLAANLEKWFSGYGFAYGGVLSAATRERIHRANPTAVVFPLLAFADMLEEVP